MIKYIIKKIITIILNIIKILIFLVLTFFILSVGYPVIFFALPKKIFDWQIIFYLTFSISTIFSIWIFLFKKIDIKKKLLLCLFFIAWLFLPRVLPNVMQQINLETCIDTGMCSENFKAANKEGKVFVISKETCIKYGYTWHEKQKSCNLKSLKSNE